MDKLELNLTNFIEEEKIYLNNFLQKVNIETFDINSAEQIDKYCYYLFNVAINRKKYFVYLAKIYFEIGNFERSFFWYEVASQKGDAYAHYQLGFFYLNGVNAPTFKIEIDLTKAFNYILKSANEGLNCAKCKIGCFFEEGIGTSKSTVQALKWFKNAASKGDCYSICMVGHYYEYGLGGLRVNFEEALRMYKIAINKNYDWAFFKMGNMYELGHYFSIDFEKALDYYKLAEEKGCMMAKYQIGLWLEKGIHFEKNVAKAIEIFSELAKNETIHTRWRRNNHNHVASFHLGEIFENGIITERNIQEAINWYILAWYQGNKTAQQKIQALQEKV